MSRLDGARSFVALVVALVAAAMLLSGCLQNDPLFCCSSLESCQRNGGSGPVTPCTDPSKPYCDDEGTFGAARTCIPDPGGTPCQGPTDCTNPDRPLCVNNVCVQCEMQDQCDAMAPVCNLATHLCEGCMSAADCSALAATPQCLTSTGECVACLGPTDCGGTTPVCDANACRACRMDAECASDVCDQSTGACVDEANVIYVATTGQPSGTCTRTSPCNSFALGLAQVGGSRNTIKAASGTYTAAVTIDGKTVTILGDGAILRPAAADQDVLTVTNGADATIEGVTIRDANGLGGHVGVNCTGNTTTLRLHRSKVINNIAGGGVTISGCQFSLVNDIIALNGSTTSSAGGVQISNIAIAGLHEFEFNTVASNTGAPNTTTGVVCGIISTPIALSNSIVYGNQVSGSGAQVGGDSHCNWTYSDVGPQNVSGTGNTNADPLFVAPATQDFHLQASSPCKNAADPASTITTDIDGDPRPRTSGGFDQGADQVVP